MDPPMGDSEDDRPMDELGGGPILEITTRRDDATVTVVLEGELDLSGSDRLLAEVDEALAQAPTQSLALDLHGLRFADSAGLQAVLAVRASSADAGVACRVVAVSPAFLRIIELAGVDALFSPEELEPS